MKQAMTNSGRKLCNLFCNEDGSSVIELALISPVAAVLLLGMIDTSLAFSEKLQTEQAAQRAIEKASSYSSAGSDYSSIDDEAALEANVPVSDVAMDVWMECDRIRQDSFNSICADDELISRHISVTIVTSYTPLFKYGPIGKLMDADDNGTIPYSVAAQVRLQ